MVGDEIVDDAEHGEPLRLYENPHLHMLEETGRPVSAYTSHMRDSTCALVTSIASLDAKDGSLVSVSRPLRAGMMVSVSSSFPQ